MHEIRLILWKVPGTTVHGKNFINTGKKNVKCVFGANEKNEITKHATVISEEIIKCDSPNIWKNPNFNQEYVSIPFFVTLNNKDLS